MSGFDLSQQAERAKQEDEGVAVHIHSIDDKPMYYTEDGEDKPVTITVAGAHSSLYRREEDRQRKRKLKPKQITGQALYDDELEKAVACTLAWEGFRSGNNPMPMNRENIKKLYTHCPWVYDQIREAMHDHARFFETGSEQPQNTSVSSPE